jgi:P27 family predicted phage terminase small subunit
MGKRGPAKTPTNILKVRGSWLAEQRQNAPQAEPSLPPCPAWVSPNAAKHWDEIGGLLYSMGIMSAPFTLTLGLLVEALADYVKRAEQCRDCDEVVYTEKGAFPHPIFGMKDKAWDRVLKAAQQFGLTPATISDVTIDKPKQEEDREYRLA